MNQKGMTLIELVLCVALFGMIALIAAKKFRRANKTVVGNQTIVEQQTKTRSAIHVMSVDIRNTGCKNYLVPSGYNVFTKGVSLNAFLSGSDSSSFIHRQGDPGDTLTIYKACLDSNGVYLHDDSITYYLDSTNLMKKHNNKTLKVADYVYALQFSYGLLTDNAQLLDQTPITSTWDWKSSTYSGTSPTKTTSGNNVDFSFSGETTGKIYYYSFFSITSEQKVAVELHLNADESFLQNVDSMKCCIMNNETVLGSEKFIPGDSKINLIFPVKPSASAYLALKYWIKNPGTGILTVSGADVNVSERGHYTWTNNPSINQKKHVRSIRICMLTRSQSQTDVRNNSDITIGDITVTQYGDYAWRTVDETIDTPNNGIFNP